MDILTYPLAFLVMLGVLVTFHEFGHYLIARLSGVHILRFSVGFGRPLWSWVDSRGTEFALAVIPFGGYVRMLDDRDPEQAAQGPADATAYMDLHPRWRIAIALGGPVANLILAVLIFALLLIAGSYRHTPTTDTPEAESPLAQAGLTSPARILSVDDQLVQGWQDIGLALTNRLGETGTINFTMQRLDSAVPQQVQVPIFAWHEGQGEPELIGSLGLLPKVMSVLGEIEAESPAAKGGLATGDWVNSVNDEPINYWSELVEVIQAHPEQALSLTYVREGRIGYATVYPAAVDTPDGPIGRLGVGAAQILVRSTLLAAIPGGVVETWDKTIMTVSIIKKMFTGQVSVKNLSGPIQIAQVAGDSARYGWRQFLGIMAFLSISLGVLNLLPIPILDGGHVVFSSVEWVTGQPVSERVQIWGVQVGLFLVGSMFVLATYNDLLRLF